MKKIISIVAMASAVLAVSCSKQETTAQTIQDEFTTIIKASVENTDTKIIVDPADGYKTKVSKGDKFQSWAAQGETKSELATLEVTSEDGEAPITFGAVTYKGITAGQSTRYVAGTYQKAGYPGSGNVSESKKMKLGWAVEANQTYNGQKITSETCANAIPLYAVTEQFSEPQSEVALNFTHVCGYFKITVNNVTLTDGDEIKSIGINSANRAFIGTIRKNMNDEYEVDAPVAASTITSNVSSLHYAEGTGSTIIVARPTKFGATANQIWTVKIIVETVNGSVYEKSGSLKGKYLEPGHVLPITVDFAGVAAK